MGLQAMMMMMMTIILCNFTPFIPPHKPATPYVRDQTVTMVKFLWLVADYINGGISLLSYKIIEKKRLEANVKMDWLI